MEWWEIILYIAVVTPIIVLWLSCMIDVISRPDLGGVTKVLWTMAILFVPILGSILYILLRPTVIIPQAPQASALDTAWQAEPRGVADAGLEETRQSTP